MLQQDGPIEKLATLMLSGEKSLDQALIEATAPDIVAALHPDYVSALAERLRNDAIDGDWMRSVPTFRLLLAALDAASAVQPPTRRAAVLNWIETVAAACHDVPDGRIFADGRLRGEALIATEIAAGEPGWAAATMHRLGVMHLDPYTVRRSHHDYENDVRMWRQRFVDRYGAKMALDAATKLPEPLAALETSIRYFEGALAGRQGEQRGLTLKALAQALLWRGMIAKDDKRMCASAAEALRLLPADKFPNHVPFLRSILERCEQPGQQANSDRARPTGDADYLIWLDPKDVIASYGETRGIERYLMAAEAAFKTNPHLALALLLRIWPLLGHQPEKRQAAVNIGNTLVRIFDSLALVPRNGTKLNDSAATLVRQAAANGWPKGRLGAAIAALGLATTAVDREGEGLAILEQALDFITQANPALAAPLHIGRAGLLLGRGVNAYRAQYWDTATQEYVAAAGAFAEEGLVDGAVDALEKAADVTFRNFINSPAPLASGLAVHTARLSVAGAPRLGDKLQEIWTQIIDRTASAKSIDLELLWLEMQAGKGAAFAATLAQPSRYDWRQDAEASGTLARIEELRKFGDRVTPENPIADALLLVSYVGAQGPGADPLANLERRFDAHVLRRMTDGRAAFAAMLKPAELSGSLGSGSVLLSQYVGDRAGLRVVFVNALSTGEGTEVSTHDGPLLETAAPPDTTETAWLGPSVAALRRELEAEPGPAEATREAEEALAQDAGLLFGGGLAEQLVKLRQAGKTHLCIHPHGPLHFHPQHLIGPEGAPIAEDWIVTYVPHPSLLRAPALGEPVANDSLVALGLDFSDGEPHGLPPLENAGLEAETIASITGGRCWVNRKATKTRLLEALASARRVHISTHGAQNAHAPVFQHLYLQPDQVSDGIFRAYEIIGLDLRHLDLVTLSACETSLGRFDIGDTLRGLAANLFTAGVATIIATLWPVGDRPARRFFDVFYRSLSGGSSKLAAFRTAQTETRLVFPAYRDWGAFQYIGRW